MQGLHDIERIYFLGIGGAGMSALARYFHQRGVAVSGYDKQSGPVTRALQEEGMVVSHTDDPSGLGQLPGLVVHTPALPKDSRLYRHFEEHKVPILKRARVLGILSQEKDCIAVAGTHGKTSICAMLTHIMMSAGIPCLSFMGGISKNYHSNYAGSPGARWMIAEADEFDRSFLELSPRIALISAIDADHLDIYGTREALAESFSLFARRLPPDGLLVAKKGIAQQIAYRGRLAEYALSGPADYHTDKLSVAGGQYQTRFAGLLPLDDISLGQAGRHNVENALAAAALAHQAGVGAEQIRKAMNSFLGVRRRFDIRLQTKDVIYVDDYAHHPEEIRACISSARELWPGKKLTVVFQPHLYSRTRDMAGEFAASLSVADELWLTEIYPAREDAIPGVDANLILQKMDHPKAAIYQSEEILQKLRETPVELLITMGAGDIDRLAGVIVETLQNKELP